jgi:hypothetical protein
MNILTLSNKIKTNNDQGGLYDLFEQFIVYRPDIGVFEFEVQEFEEMRIDLIFQRMYDFDPIETGLYLENIDVILFLNGLDNPLNIKKGMILRYPAFTDLGKFRYEEDADSRTKNKTPLLAVPNVSTKKDKSRENFKKNGYSLPPVALSNPKPAVRSEDGIVKVGGL